MNVRLEDVLFGMCEVISTMALGVKENNPYIYLENQYKYIYKINITNSIKTFIQYTILYAWFGANTKTSVCDPNHSCYILLINNQIMKQLRLTKAQNK